MTKTQEQLIEFCVLIAASAKLSNPIGRGVCMASRIFNSGRGRYSSPTFDDHDPEFFVSRTLTLDAMRKMHEETADRWFQHYYSGGSLRKLGR